MLTGLTDEHFGVSAVASGAQDYLVKARGARDAPPLGALRNRAEARRADRGRTACEPIPLGENVRLARGLLPSPLLLDDPNVDIVTRYRPSRAYALLGGDFYDVVQTPDRTVQRHGR